MDDFPTYRDDVLASYMEHMPDQVFKRIFTKNGNLPLLQDLVSSILDIPYDSIKDISIVSSELAPSSGRGKVCHLDLLLNVDDTKVNIELQFGNRKGFSERTTYYMCRIVENCLRSGDPYHILPKVICINIVDFKMFSTPDYHTTFQVLSTKHSILMNEIIRFDFLELCKIPKLPRECTPSDRKLLWMHFFNIRSEEDANMVYAIRNPKLRQAVEELRKTKTDEELFPKLLAIEMYERDLDNYIACAKEEAKDEGKAEGIAEGKAEGKAEGIAEGKAETTRNILELRFAAASSEQIEEVLRYSGRKELLVRILQADSIEALLEELRESE